ncbi:MAG: carboxylesterase/lipase family protein [Pseudomonadota bacterium]
MDRDLISWSRRGLLALPAALAVAPAQASAAAGPVARTQYGRVRGASADGLFVFKGIRYGADTAPRRFQAPAPPTPWRGVADALAYGAASPQRGMEPNQSEDCLFLNVWTPAFDHARRAVMVYIHGGAYSSGSGSGALLDGARLAKHGDVVVVTLNHRLGALGYAYLARIGGDAFADSGNTGQLDLILALQWVRDNIAEFGGDPGRVMVFGQSGGGAKIATLMAMPAAASLFHRAATMSGQQVTASGPLNATRRAESFVQAAGLTHDTIAQIRTLPVARVLDAMAPTDPVLGFGSLYFGPVLDEKNLLRHPFYPDAAPQSLSIPMMLGNMHDETRGFVGGDRSVFDLSWDDVPHRLESAMRVDISPELVVREYRRLYPNYSPSDVYFAASTAARSWRGQVIEAEERARAGAPGYVYQLNWRAPAEGGIFGSPHTLDIPLVFGNLEASSFVGERTAEGEAMSRQMMDAFVAFAKTGDPNCASIPRWAPYTLPTRETMIFDTVSRMENDPRRAERELFAKVPYIQPGA